MQIVLPHVSETIVNEDFIISNEFRGWMEEINLKVSKRSLRITGTTFTTDGSSVLICDNTSPAVITLNPSPRDGEILYIKIRDDQVTLDGDIDGSTLHVMSVAYDFLIIMYTEAAQEWSIISK